MSLVPEIAPDRVEVSPLSAEIRGAEVSAVSEGHDFNWWVGLAWSEAFDKIGEDASRAAGTRPGP
jgi:hypothetical protein